MQKLYELCISPMKINSPRKFRSGLSYYLVPDTGFGRMCVFEQHFLLHTLKYRVSFHFPFIKRSSTNVQNTAKGKKA